ncbi:MAG: hypothetical protein Q8O88_03210 [bacterium]|nr:hypothetical protein [bacterium]
MTLDFFKHINKKGFSIIEIIIVVVSMAVMIILGSVNYRFFERRVELSTSASHIIDILNLARDRTVSSDGGSVYGVHFESGEVTLFKGVAYVGSDPADSTVYIIPSSIEINNIAITGGANDVVYSKISGETTNIGSLGLRIIQDPGSTETINVISTGRAGTLGTVTQTGTRVIDARHTHFDLGWSIQGATNLELHFEDTPNVDETIVMADYFNPGQTEFDWIGTIDVNGESQTVRVHTHSIDVVDTVLCVHRDGRVNTKPLDISLDGQDIVSITAGGLPTVGFFGGTMTIQ